ncbi:MAG: choice-of-anchor V domain-containing protein [Gemmatimonadales bacterium]
MPTRSVASSCLSLAGLGALAALGASLAAAPSPPLGPWATYKDGPPPAYTGGFGEPTCHACHVGAPLNEAGGTLAIDGVPDRYQPGRPYDLEVTLRREGMRRSGIELAARLADGDRAGTQAGVLAPADDRTVVVRDSSTRIEYLTHTLVGTSVAAGGTGRWTFRWTAPADASERAVVFHIAANAANDDDSPLGDFIYARALRVLAGTTR